MKKIHKLMIILVIMIILTIATPALASETSVPIGERINLYLGTPTFAAGESFHIRHGWIQTSEDGAIGIFDFRLEVDGVYVSNFFRDFSAISGEPDTLRRIWVYNFPQGMTGTHTFTGHWFAPCQYAVDNLGYEGICTTPNQKVETNTKTLVVEFQ